MENAEDLQKKGLVPIPLPTTIILAHMSDVKVENGGKATNEARGDNTLAKTTSAVVGPNTEHTVSASAMENKKEQKKENTFPSAQESMRNMARHSIPLKPGQKIISLTSEITVSEEQESHELSETKSITSEPTTPPQSPLPTPGTFLWGKDDFRDVARKNGAIVDKTKFIVEVLTNPASFILVTRPAGFGKSFNLSMLYCFLDSFLKSAEVDEYFKDTKIYREYFQWYRNKRGKYPVIYVTFKNITAGKFEDALQDFTVTLEKLYKDVCEKYGVKPPEDLNFRTSGEATLKASLACLCELVYKKCKKKPFLLIDAFDTPLYMAYKYTKYSPYKNNLSDPKSDYAKMDTFLKTLVSSATKTNPYIEKAILTGTMPLAAENLLSNAKVCRVVETDFDDCFGFTQIEIQKELNKAFGKPGQQAILAELMGMLPELMRQHSGYRIGLNNMIPSGIATRFIGENHHKAPGGTIHRVGSFDQEITHDKEIIDLFIAFKGELAKDLAKLVAGKYIVKKIQPEVIFADMNVEEEEGSEILWTFLLCKGYLSILNVSELSSLNRNTYALVIPNKELLGFFSDIARRIGVVFCADSNKVLLQINGIDKVREELLLLGGGNTAREYKGISGGGIESVKVNIKGDTSISSTDLLRIDTGSFQKLEGNKVEVLNQSLSVQDLSESKGEAQQITLSPSSSREGYAASSTDGSSTSGSSESVINSNNFFAVQSPTGLASPAKSDEKAGEKSKPSEGTPVCPPWLCTIL
jgi:hypothetical protein